jgi:zinc protease
MKQLWVVWLVVAVACGVEHPKTEPARVLQVALDRRVYQLPNGATAILVPDPHADVASVLVRYQVGTIDEPPEQPGVAHLAAHLLYSQRVAKQTLWTELDRIGTWINTTPSDSTTDFTVRAPVSALGDVMRLEAQRLAHRCDGVTDDDLVRERTNVANELSRNPTWLINRSVAHELYPATNPYHRSYDAEPAAIMALGRDQVCAFIAGHYVASNATVVVSGPVDPNQFRYLVESTIGTVPATAATPRPAIAEPPAIGSRVSIKADVAAPTLSITWPRPTDPGARAVMKFASVTLATMLNGTSYIDDNTTILWFSANPNGLDATLDQVRAALRRGLSARNFERERTREVTFLLDDLDDTDSRLTTVMASDLAAPFQALERLTQQSLNTFVATNLNLDRARILEIEPDGTRAPWHSVGLADPPHILPDMIVDGSEPSTDAVLAVGPSKTLHGARTFTLANGMHVILMRTTDVPIVDIRLEFDSGEAAQPIDHRGTADAAIHALLAVAHRGPHVAQAGWTFGLATAWTDIDTSEIDVSGPAMYVDLLVEQFEGLASSHFSTADVRLAHRRIGAAVSKTRRDVDEAATMRAAIFGSAHPYARSLAPDATDLSNFDAGDVRAYIEHHLQPSNATLIATGGFDLDVMTRLVQDTFVGWEGHGEPPTMQAAAGTPAMFAAADQSTRVTLKIEWGAGVQDPKISARMLLAHMLNTVSSSVTASMAHYRQGGVYSVSGTFDPEQAPGAIKDIYAKLRRIGDGSDFDREVFRTARRREALTTNAASWSANGWVRRLGYAVQMGHDIPWLEAIYASFAKVTYDDVAALAKSELGIDRASCFISGPRDAVTAVYAALGVTPVWKN